MPELAEVEFYRKRWAAGRGDPVQAVEANGRSRVFRNSDANAISRALPGQPLTEALAHGKRMLFGFGHRWWLEAHLGMSGRLLAEPGGYEQARHDHLVLRQEARTLVFHDPRMFGRVTLHESEGLPEFWLRLPPELVSSGFTRRWVADFLRRRPGTALKAALLDQAGFPGVGNWMADEILWRCGFYPAVRAGELTEGDADRLWRETRWVGRAALKVIGSDWGDPPATWLFRHRWRDGGRCPRRGCGSLLIRDEVGGRTTCWCPVCQS